MNNFSWCFCGRFFTFFLLAILYSGIAKAALPEAQVNFGELISISFKNNILRLPTNGANVETVHDLHTIISKNPIFRAYNGRLKIKYNGQTLLPYANLTPYLDQLSPCIFDVEEEPLPPFSPMPPTSLEARLTEGLASFNNLHGREGYQPPFYLFEPPRFGFAYNPSSHMSGNIGVFQTGFGTPLGDFLMSPDSHDIPYDALRAEAIKLGASSETFHYQANVHKELIIAELTPDLWKAALEKISDFTEFLWAEKSQRLAEPFQDMRAVISDDLFSQLIGDASVSKRLIYLLHDVLWQRDDSEVPESRIVLRMVTGPTHAGIGFHIDYPNATRTLQVMLSDPLDYTGGRLAFFTFDPLDKSKDTFSMLERTKGSACWHSGWVLHGVTSLLSGERKSLFVIDKNKGPLENNMDLVTKEQVDRFISRSL